MADEPANDSILEQDGQGRLFIVELQPDGTSKRTPATNAEALAYLDRMVAAYGADNVPVGSLQPGKGGVEDRVLTRSELVDKLAYLVARLRKENPGDDAATITALKAAVTSPKTIQALAADPRVSRDTLRNVWPDLDQILAWVPTPGEGGQVGGTGTAADAGAKGTSLAEAGGGTGQGTGSLPPPTPPPLIQAGQDGGTATGTGTGTGGAATRYTPPGGGTSATDAVRAGDPVLPFSGQLLIEAVDLEVEGIGLDVRIARTYMHDTGYDGPLGPHWDHGYNLWLRERLEQLPDGRFEFAVYRSTGRLSAERFVADNVFDDMVDPGGVADATLSAATGTQDRLEKVAGRYRLTTPDGLRIAYGDTLRAERLIDRNGNEVRLTWSADPPVLERLTDTCGRTIRFAHDADGRMTGVHDDALGREIRYVYDDAGRLERVLRRTVADGPLELVQAFRYRGDGAPRGMEANIVAILDARGREVLQSDYGEEPGLLSFNRVVEQRDGGITRYVYGFISEPDPDVPDDPTATGVIRVEMTTPDSVLHVLDYNARGRLVTHSVEALGVGPVVHRWRHNADGNLLVERRPDGGATEYVYGRELYEAAGGDAATAPFAERVRFGELRRVIEHRRAGVAGPPQRITEFDYGLPTLVKERRGPYYADALGNRVGGGPPFAIRVEHDALGNPMRVAHPDCTRPDGTVQTGLELEFQRDGLGRLTRHSLELEDGSTIATTYGFAPAGGTLLPRPLREVVDADGMALEHVFDYDAGGRLVRAAMPTGLTEQFELDLAGRLLRVEERGPDAPLSVVTTQWAPHDVPQQTVRLRTAANGHDEPGAALTETFEFDAEGDVRASTVRSGDGKVDRRVEVERGPERRLRRILEDGVAIEQHYDARGLVVRREVRAPGIAPLVTTFTYDAAARMRTMTAPTGQTETMVYDGFGRVAERHLPGGSRATYEWDANDRLLRHEVNGRHPDVAGDVVLHRERRGYDACGRLAWEETGVFDPAQPTPVGWARREYFYDRADRVIEVRGPGPTRQRFAYDGLGRVVHTEDDAGSVAQAHFHDVARRVDHELTVSGTGPGGPVSMSFTSGVRLNARGHVIATVDGLGNELQSEFDSDGNLVATVDAQGVRHEQTYAADGVVDQVRLAAGLPSELSWQNTYDATRRLVAVDGMRGRLLDVDRDAVGRIAGFHVAGGGPLTYRYDDAGRMVEAHEPSGITVSVDYGPDGRISRRRTDVSGRTGTTARDALPSSQIDYSYDGLGQLVLADDGTTPVARRYDSRGLILSERTGTRKVKWTHDVSGAPASFEFSDGTRLTFERDAQGLLKRVLKDSPATPEEIARLWPLGSGMVRDVEWRGTVRRSERRDAAGRLLALDAVRVADGSRPVRLLHLADERGLPAVRQTVSGTDQELRVYDVDDLAHIVGQSFGSPLAQADTEAIADALDAAESPAGAQAAVDAAIAQSRTALGTPPAEDERFDLDADGARRKRTQHAAGVAGATLTYTPTTTGFPVAQGVARTEDADGLPSKLGGAALAYDDSARLTSVTRPATAAVNVARDALGRVHKITTAAGDIELVHDGMTAVEAHRAGAPTVRIVRPPGSRLVLEVQAGTAVFHPLADPDGTTIALMDDTGAVVATSGFDAFGRRRNPTGSWPPLAETFHGMPPLVDELFLTPSRTYDAGSGSFLERDQALHLDGPDLHLFAHGNPAAFVDPLGLMAQPSASTGRGAPNGAFYGHGSRRPDTWYLRALSAMGGALWSIWGMITEPVKQVYDLAGGLVGFVGDLTGLYHYEHRYASGIGQLAEHGKGTLDIFGAMGKGLVETPKRVLEAMEREDYASFGAEALNFYMIARPVGETVFNRSVGALGSFGKTGASWRAAIRQWQIDRMVRANPRFVAGQGVGGVTYKYSPTRAWFGRFYETTKVASITEAAFTPSLRQMFTLPSQMGGVVGQAGRFAQLRWSVDNFLRGNLVLRTLVHERWHATQFAMGSSRYMGMLEAPYFASPLEWTQPAGAGTAAPFEGAWNREMILPYGSAVETLVMPLNLSLSSIWGRDEPQQ